VLSGNPTRLLQPETVSGSASGFGVRTNERLVLGQEVLGQEVLGQSCSEACAEKSNETTAIPALLAQLAACCNHKGALVSIDAIT